ncbi:AraC family transcriptional regulator [bacterium]|nr:MAG: AraC family transcriptional regulator [bacterium]
MPNNDTKEPNKDVDLNKNSRYEKSSLTDEQLIFYQEKLTKAMLDEKLYLNPTLSLTSLSTYLKLPNHHLTQVFSVQINQTFYQYINSLRIAYACQLLKSEEANMNFEELADQSGFNSKPSFNRQFKLIMNCTPSEYRISVQNK